MTTAALTEVMVHALGEFRAERNAEVPNEEKLLRNAALVERTAEKLRRGGKGVRKEGPPDADVARQLTLFSVIPEKTVHPTLAELNGELPMQPPRPTERR